MPRISYKQSVIEIRPNAKLVSRGFYTSQGKRDTFVVEDNGERLTNYKVNAAYREYIAWGAWRNAYYYLKRTIEGKSK